MKVRGQRRMTSLLAVAILFGAACLLTTSLLLNSQHRLVNDNVVDDSTLSSAASDGKFVVILTYQRCGSSFFASLFNFDENAFYVFEPIDSLYSHLYGVTPGWNVPSDITTFANGTTRPIPTIELTAVSRFLACLFLCDIKALPTETLLHHFFHLRRSEMTSTGDYVECLKRADVSPKSFVTCYKRLRGICPERFGNYGPAAHNRCNRLLHGDYTHERKDPGLTRSLDNFTSCLSQQRTRIDVAQCPSLLKSACSSRRLRVVKTVRATMQSMQLLLRLMPDKSTRIIHLVRDPRAVALSRLNYNPSGQGHHTNAVKNSDDRFVREASIYCRQVVADVRWRLRLEREFPGRLYSLTYEQLVDDPVGQASDIYRFIGETPAQSAIFNFTSLASAGSRNMSAVELASNWRTNVTSTVLTRINRDCRDMFNMYPQYANITSLA